MTARVVDTISVCVWVGGGVECERSHIYIGSNIIIEMYIAYALMILFNLHNIYIASDNSHNGPSAPATISKNNYHHSKCT